MRRFLLLFVTLTSALFAQEQNVVSAGAELCQIKRMRDGGTQQNGLMNGVRFSYDRIKAYSWYLGLDYFSGQARMDGHTGSGRDIFSTIRDTISEGRLGFTFQPDIETHPFFVLFGGYGVFKEVNSFSDPTPLPLTFTEEFHYISTGFLSGVHLSSLVIMGVNFKMMFMLDGTSQVTDDPLREDVTLQMNDEINLRLEFPFLATPEWTKLRLCVSCVPFVEFRHFGGREGHPFDFIDTKFNLLGGRLSLVSSF